MIFILIIVIALVAWALHLMQEAIQNREFSLMLAGFLVSAAAAAMMAVYFLMGHYVVYMAHTTQPYQLSDSVFESAEWVASESIWLDDWADAQTAQANESRSF